MAGKVKPGADPEIQYGPKEGEDSLADDLDNRREVTAGMLLGGHPNMEEEETPPGGEEETPEQKAAREAAEAEAAAKGKPPEKKEEEPPKPRFKSQEEAEKAHSEAEKEMTKAKMEAAEERRAREKVEAELAELRTKPPVKEEKPPAETKPQLSKEERRTKITEISRAYWQKVWALDNTSPTYQDDVTNLMVEMNEAMLDLGATPAQRTEEIESLIEGVVEKKLKARDEVRAAEDRKTAAEKAWDKAVAYGLEAGLELNDPESADHDLFMVAESRLPEELRGKGFTKEVGEWMVNYVRTRTGKVAMTEAEKEAAAKKAQEENQTLGRGGLPKPKPKPEEETEGSLKEDFEEARGRRIL
jgi:hypothetical protein